MTSLGQRGVYNSVQKTKSYSIIKNLLHQLRVSHISILHACHADQSRYCSYLMAYRYIAGIGAITTHYPLPLPRDLIAL